MKKNFLILSFYALIPMFLIVIQPNLGMTLICFFITLGIYFISGLNLKVLYIGFASIIPLSLIIWFSGILKTYQRQRILVFLDPETYQQNAGFQLMQSIIGIGSGVLFSVFQNIGMTIGIMPVAGITLPFMSYGGSSILVNFMSLGLVLNVGMRKNKINF